MEQGKTMISTKGRYALRVLIDLAEHDNGNFVPLKDIAERQEVSKKYLEIIVKDMSINGVKFTSRHHFDMGTDLTFTLDLGRRKYMDVYCTVIRRGSDNSGESMSYIARLDNAAGREEEICSFLLQKQGELYNMSK